MKCAIPTMFAAAFVLASTSAFAHTGHSEIGLVHGFSHPITGIDHVLAMIATGLLAAQLGGRALWLIPLAFVSIMMVGGAVGMAGIAMPFAEFGVALSLVIFGLGVAFPFGFQTPAVTALVGLFALFHGHVHGLEMPAAASGLYYMAGFACATTLLHAVGIGLGIGLARAKSDHLTIQIGGSAIALFGMVMLTNLI